MRKISNVLQYSRVEASQATVRRQYTAWREAQGLPTRCDSPECVFHTAPLAWNGKSLKLILDHVDGNRRDNRPEHLRFLCPNCDSQLHTRGGGNRGRVETREDGFTVRQQDGSRATDIFLTERIHATDHCDATVVPGRRGERRGPTRG
jgi:hypothetical protein